MCGCKQGTCPGNCACGCRHTPPTMAEQRLALVENIGTYMMGASAEVMVGVRSANGWVEKAAAEVAGQWLEPYEQRIAAKALYEAADWLFDELLSRVDDAMVVRPNVIPDLLRKRADSIGPDQ